ncbi:hypothetical protein KUH03_08270 [Sphingobacterium sp. E70]|uniref:hypothetical protein n=1 Tax=Sphingobacterium sp. E70 TaxID=2853439 RepID=UPI00211C2C75|nr:hypothetical protein [Sphingobacterium sp. E70]ULT26811.1 hypothetical protein KUH03_08270 [Sphingobacterium sp. E70]
MPAEYWVNVFGIKSGFALQENNLSLAEQYLLQCISQIKQDGNNFYKSEYTVFKQLSDIANKKNDLRTAFSYQTTAEQLLKKTFDQQQIFNTQKLEVQYESEKKKPTVEIAEPAGGIPQKQNYLYGGIALALLAGLCFMFRSYHFKLRYSIERERKLQQEHEETEKGQPFSCNWIEKNRRASGPNRNCWSSNASNWKKRPSPTR